MREAEGLDSAVNQLMVSREVLVAISQSNMPEEEGAESELGEKTSGVEGISLSLVCLRLGISRGAKPRVVQFLWYLVKVRLLISCKPAANGTTRKVKLFKGMLKARNSGELLDMSFFVCMRKREGGGGRGRGK